MPMIAEVHLFTVVVVGGRWSLVMTHEWVAKVLLVNEVLVPIGG